MRKLADEPTISMIGMRVGSDLLEAVDLVVAEEAAKLRKTFAAGSVCRSSVLRALVERGLAARNEEMKQQGEQR